MRDGLFRYIDNQGIEPNQVWCEDACHKSMDMDSDEIADLKSSTRGQSENDKWKDARKGRITATNFYSIHTRMESHKLQTERDMSRLIDKDFWPNFHLKTIICHLVSASYSSLLMSTCNLVK